ncbi:MAG: Crp/Fnr family transcriptional regulator [Vicinamibacterales bacterium]
MPRARTASRSSKPSTIRKLTELAEPATLAKIAKITKLSELAELAELARLAKVERLARLAESAQGAAFDAQSYLDSAGPARRIVSYRRGAKVFAQGGPGDSVMYLQRGGIKISVLSRLGKEAVVAMLTPGDFFGEGALTGQPVRIVTATATMASTVLVIEKDAMVRLLHEQETFANRFIKYMLARNIRIEADLVDHLFNSSEKRLARTLLLLARYGQLDNPHNVLPTISQETLAEMIGTTRSRVNFFMNKFKKLGFIEYNGDLRINSSLLTVVLHD